MGLLGWHRRVPLRCPICGTRVQRDDAIGLIDGAMGHAECALVHMLCGIDPDPADSVESRRIIGHILGNDLDACQAGLGEDRLTGEVN